MPRFWLSTKSEKSSGTKGTVFEIQVSASFRSNILFFHRQKLVNLKHKLYLICILWCNRDYLRYFTVSTQERDKYNCTGRCSTLRRSANIWQVGLEYMYWLTVCIEKTLKCILMFLYISTGNGSHDSRRHVFRFRFGKLNGLASGKIVIFIHGRENLKSQTTKTIYAVGLIWKN
jgi:hypothetical protein